VQNGSGRRFLRTAVELPAWYDIDGTDATAAASRGGAIDREYGRPRRGVADAARRRARGPRGRPGRTLWGGPRARSRRQGARRGGGRLGRGRLRRQHRVRRPRRRADPCRPTRSTPAQPRSEPRRRRGAGTRPRGGPGAVGHARQRAGERLLGRQRGRSRSASRDAERGRPPGRSLARKSRRQRRPRAARPRRARLDRGGRGGRRRRRTGQCERRERARRRPGRRRRVRATAGRGGAGPDRARSADARRKGRTRADQRHATERRPRGARGP